MAKDKQVILKLLERTLERKNEEREILYDGFANYRMFSF